MAKEKNTAALDASADHFPEHGPVDKSGREVLLSLRHVDINFGKGENRVRAVQDVSFDIYKGETFSPTPARTARYSTRASGYPVKYLTAWTER